MKEWKEEYLFENQEKKILTVPFNRVEKFEQIYGKDACNFVKSEIIEFISYLAVVAERIVGEIIEMILACDFREAVYRHVAVYLLFIFVGTFCTALRIFLDPDIIDILAIRVKSVDIESTLERLSE